MNIDRTPPPGYGSERIYERIPCPFCRADAREKCRTRAGETCAPHPARERAWREREKARAT